MEELERYKRKGGGIKVMTAFDAPRGAPPALLGGVGRGGTEDYPNEEDGSDENGKIRRRDLQPLRKEKKTFKYDTSHDPACFACKSVGCLPPGPSRLPKAPMRY